VKGSGQGRPGVTLDIVGVSDGDDDTIDTIRIAESLRCRLRDADPGQQFQR
jgi:hypothetical protein